MNERQTPVRTGESALQWQGFKPFQLVRLYDMLRRYAAAFYGLGFALEKLSFLATVRLTDDLGADEAAEGAQALYERQLAKALEYSEKCELDISVIAIKELQSRQYQLINNPAVAAAILEIQNTIRRELEAVALFLVPKNRQKFYTELAPLGIDVYMAFPSAGYDIGESAKCFAFERYTASAMHACRAVEVALNALAIAIGAEATVPSWDGILKKIDTELPKKYTEKVWNTETENFYAEAALHLRSYKNIRNATQHAEKRYTPEESEQLYDAVKLLMQHLCKKLAEPTISLSDILRAKKK